MAVKRWNGTAWEVYAGADLAPVKVTDGRVGKTTFIGATSPTGQVDGDIWIDQDTTTNAVVPTALTTKGDTFVATGNAAYTRLAAGNNGESLFADSSTNTGLRWQGDYNTGKNKILNGDFAIWQRGISFSGDGYTADRWRFSKNASTTASVSRQPFTLGSAPAAPYESQYFARYQRTAGAFDDYFLQRVEDARTLANTPSKLSFWAKSSANINISQVYAAQTTNGSGGGASGVFSGVAITTSWVRYSIDINLPSLSGATLGANNFVEIVFKFGSEMGNITVDIWGVQWEAGSIATPFTTATGNQALELAACQRYYEKSYSQGTDPGASVFAGISGNASGADSTGYTACVTTFKVTKRTPPSIVVYDTSGNINRVTSFRNDGTNTANKTATVDPVSDTAFRIYETGTLKNGLFYHYVASAEL